MDLIDTQTTRVIAKALDGLSQRHTALAANIANAETPGYRGLNVNFEGTLAQAIEAENQGGQPSQFLPEGSLRTTDNRHINPNPVASSTADANALVERSSFLYRYDRNGVDIEQSMAQLARNAERYTVLSKLEGKQFSSLHRVISGGGNA